MANMQETAADWAPLEAPEHGDPSRSQRGQRLTGKALLVGSLIGLAVGAALLVTSSAPNAGEFTSEGTQPQFTQKEPAEMVASPSQLLKISSIQDFNGLLATSIVMDANTMDEAMPTSQVEVLFNDFLENIGSEAPNADGMVQASSKTYHSKEERDYRFGVFQKNVLSIMKHNAEEYAQNPDANRARYGITVHADFTEDEFVTTRLNMKAVNKSSYASMLNVGRPAQVKEKKASVSKFMDFRNSTELIGSCGIETGGSCRFLRCNPSRGAQCYGGACVCIDGACAQEGRCMRPGGCQIGIPGSSCRFFGCSASRNAECVDHNCECAAGSCAVGGKCVPQSTPAPPPPPPPPPAPAPFAPSTPAPTSPIHCSEVYTSGVRNQGQCGDCWAFSTAQQLRYMAFKKYGRDPGVMSVQYMVDCMPDVAKASCDEGVKGCCGGLPYRADMWLESSGGLPAQAQYGPLRSDKHPNTAYHCQSPRGKKVKPIGVQKFNEEQDIANQLCAKGPVSIAIQANTNLQHYIGGIMTESRCPAEGINHAILYVGVDRTHDNGNPVHILLNSWGTSWGVNPRAPYLHDGSTKGHMLFKYGENVCNMKALATAPEDVEMR